MASPSAAPAQAAEHRVARLSDRLLRWYVLSCVALAFVTALVMIYVFIRQTRARDAAPVAESLPSIQLPSRRSELTEATVELRNLDFGIDSTADAIARLSKVTSMTSSEITAELGFARLYLMQHEVPESERRWLVLTLLSPHVPLLFGEDIALLAKYGQPSDGPALARKKPPRDHVPAWFALLEEWNAAPSHDALASMFHDGMGDGLRREYETRKSWPNVAAIRALTAAYRQNPMKDQLLGVLSDADARAVRIYVGLETGRHPPADWIEAAGKTPPGPEMRTLCVQSARSRFATFREVGQVVWYLPILESWNEPELWDAVLRIVSDEARQMSTGDRARPGTKERRAAIERLVWSYERNRREEIGKMLAALGPPQGAPSLWAVEEMARRRPDLAKQAGIVLVAISADTAAANSAGKTPVGSSGKLGDSGPVAGSDAPLDVTEALTWLRTGDTRKVVVACHWLGTTRTHDANQAEVLAALTAHLARNDEGLDAARSAYCHWAGPEAENIVVSIAMNSRDDAVMAAAVRALLRLQSSRLHVVGRLHATVTPWSDDLASAWAAGQERGEEALCNGIIAIRDRRPVSDDALAFLGEHGSRRSLAVLKNLGDAPHSDRSAIDAAIRTLEQRLPSSP